jgi:hypothetical protein
MSTRTGRNYSEKTPTVPSVAVVPAVPAVPAVVAEMEILKDSGGKIGDPTQHHRYSSFREGHFSDFTLTWNEKKYSVHRCILFHESKLFQEMFTNEWKDVTEAEITIPNKSYISQSDRSIPFIHLYQFDNISGFKRLVVRPVRIIDPFLSQEITVPLH